MSPDDHRHRLRQHPLIGRRCRVIVIQTPVRGVVPVHGVLGRPERTFIGRQVDLSVTHRIERPGLREGLSSMVLQKSILALAEFRH